MSQNKLPKDWKWVKLNEICDKISLNKIKIKQKQYLLEGKYPVIDQGQDLIGGYFNDEKLIVPNEPPYIIFGDHTKIKKFINFKFIPGADGVKVLKPKEIIDPKFLFYSLFTIKIEDKGYARHFQLLEKELFPLPPHETQQAIVSKIEELFSELDKGIEDLKTAQLQLKTYRQSVLKWAFEGKLTNEKVKDGVLPKGWEITTLGVACERIFDGTHFSPKNYPTGKYKYITAKNIKEKGIDLTKISYVSEEDHREIYSRSNVKRGDVLYIKDGATTGIACINNFDEEFSLLSSVGVFRVNHEKIESKYLCYFLNSQVTRNKMLSNIAGVAITRLTLIKLKNSEFILAPFKEQHKIVQEIESRLSVADKMEESITQSLQQAEALRQSILKKAFSGDLV